MVYWNRRLDLGIWLFVMGASSLALSIYMIIDKAVEAIPVLVKLENGTEFWRSADVDYVVSPLIVGFAGVILLIVSIYLILTRKKLRE